MVFTLLIAAVVTLVLGLPVFVWGRALPEGVWGLVLFIASMIVSMGAGIAIITRRDRSRIIPIASVYIVVMFGVLVGVAFLIAWYRGQVEL